MRSSRNVLVCAGLLWLLAFVPGSTTLVLGETATELLGFQPDRVADQQELERKFDAQIEAAELVEWSRRMTVAPHHAGSPQALANAQMMAGLFRSWGFDTTIETFWVLFPTPKKRELTLIEPHRFQAELSEGAVERDSTSKLAVEAGLPPFNAYSGEGDVTAELVYVNQGVPRDYEELERRGVEVAGKIVIARYGGSWRGIKPKVAAERGALGCLIYNDPLDDGYSQGVAYPDGPYKHSSAVQRGSVLDLPVRPGDPLTPMRGATEDAERLSWQEAETVMKIPVLPLSWEDAKPLLEALGGPVAPPSWRGALPITYRIGPGPAKVRLRLEFNWETAPAHNVIGRLRGSERPDEWIIRGNHHDAWVIGGRDPISGMIALLAEAKAVGRLAADGWRPKRSLVYAAWDAEEPGLLGSTEWVEHHAAELREKAAVYINSDSNSRGFLRAGGSAALETLVNQVAGAVQDPQTGVSVLERALSAQMVRASPKEARELDREGTLRVGALGSGSDYSPFLQHLGIASLNVGYGGEGNGGEYHTAFDSHDFFNRFVDPGAEYAVALAKTAGRLSLRLAEADVLPFQYQTTATKIANYVGEVQELAETERERIEVKNLLLEGGRYRLASDPKENFQPPTAEKEPPHLNWAPLLNARDRLRDAADAHSEIYRSVASEPAKYPSDKLLELDRVLLSGERLFIREQGLPRRPWFRNQIYSPGFYTGYGVKTLPGIREALEEGDWIEAQEQIGIVAERLEELATSLRVWSDGLQIEDGSR